MKNIIVIVILVFSGCSSPSFDIIINNGKIANGDGGELFAANIYIKDGKIIEIGNLPNAKGDRVLNAQELIIAPGFIDMHTHSERRSLQFPTVENYLQQGVTTMVGGNCGGSPFPIGSFIEKTQKKGIGPNLALLIGHNTVRKEVMGTENRLATGKEIMRMQELIQQSMEEGAFGMSTGLKYIPGAYSNTEEVIALASTVSKNNGIYSTHMREEGIGLIESVKEAIDIGRKASLPVQISHHKAVGKTMWGNSKKTLELIDNANEEGLQVTADQYPYTATSTGLTIVFPAWSLSGGSEKLKERLDNPKLRKKIKDKIIWNIIYDRGGGNPSSIVVANYPNNNNYNGLNLAQITELKGQLPSPENAAEVLMDLVYEGNGRGIYHCLDEEDVQRIMAHPQIMHASDGSTIEFGEAQPHPRSYGTYPRVLGKYVREKNVISLTESIRKMTKLPASVLGIKDRGEIKKGFWADLVIFDQKNIIDNATWNNPHQYPSGISWVLVNGKISLEDGNPSKNLNGKVLTHNEE